MLRFCNAQQRQYAIGIRTVATAVSVWIQWCYGSVVMHSSSIYVAGLISYRTWNIERADGPECRHVKLGPAEVPANEQEALAGIA
jgi:hypothetical protein